MAHLTESDIESAALKWLADMGYIILSGLEIAPGEAMAERDDYGQVCLSRRLRQALQRLNPRVPPDALEEAFRKLTRPDSPSTQLLTVPLPRSLTSACSGRQTGPNSRRAKQNCVSTFLCLERGCNDLTIILKICVVNPRCSTEKV
jgi:hypothetical protein